MNSRNEDSTPHVGHTLSVRKADANTKLDIIEPGIASYSAENGARWNHSSLTDGDFRMTDIVIINMPPSTQSYSFLSQKRKDGGYVASKLLKIESVPEVDLHHGNRAWIPWLSALSVIMALIGLVASLIESNSDLSAFFPIGMFGVWISYKLLPTKAANK